MKIWAHTLVKNEERYVWFAVMSVIEHVDKILIWDTGSSDSTVEIIKEMKKQYPRKIDFKEIGEVDIQSYTDARQKMLEETTSDWFLILDGDEVWWNEAIKEVVQVVKSSAGRKTEMIVNKYYNVVGDIYHYQEETAGRYEIDGKRGHLNIRAINRKIPGLYTAKPHGQHGYFDGQNKLIQNRSSVRRKTLNNPAFLHFTHMTRSSREFDLKVPKRKAKLKHEIGKNFPLDFYYPEVFFRPKPSIVPSPWQKMDSIFMIKSAVMTIPRMIKRRLIRGDSGY